jgi:hypothetical protein
MRQGTGIVPGTTGCQATTRHRLGLRGFADTANADI